MPSSLRPVSACVLMMFALSACTTVSDTFTGDKVDYRGATAKKNMLEVPPDLTQLSGDARFQPPTGTTVSANSYQAAAASLPTTSTAQPIAPNAVGEVRLMRDRDQRWLSTPLSADQLWPKLQAFWEDRHLGLVIDKPEVGVMETQWAENRSKLPTDVIRRTLGGVLDSIFSTGEMDRFRIRVERTPAGGTEIYLTHSGVQEVYSGADKEATVWEPRPRDRQLEGEILSLMMIRLGATEEQAKAQVVASVAPPTEPARARVLNDKGQPALQVDDGFDRAWRRIGLALDRSNFTVEDRDRGQGIYFVRYVDPKNAGKEERGFFGKLFNIGPKNEKLLARYRVNVKSEGETSTVTVQDDSGAPENGEAGQRIIKLLLDELK